MATGRPMKTKFQGESHIRERKLRWVETIQEEDEDDEEENENQNKNKKKSPSRWISSRALCSSTCARSPGSGHRGSPPSGKPERSSGRWCRSPWTGGSETRTASPQPHRGPLLLWQAGRSSVLEACIEIGREQGRGRRRARERARDGQTHRGTGREGEREIERDTDRQAETDRETKTARERERFLPKTSTSSTTRTSRRNGGAPILIIARGKNDVSEEMLTIGAIYGKQPRVQTSATMQHEAAMQHLNLPRGLSRLKTLRVKDVNPSKRN